MMKRNKLYLYLRKPAGIAIAAALVVLVVACYSAISLSPVAHASTSAGNGRIYGQLLDGTRKNAPVAKQKVTLQMEQGNTAIDLDTVTTGANGAFSFASLQTDKSISYSVYTSYQGAQYNSNLINLASKPVQHVNLTVYEATNSMEKIAIVQATVLLHAPDAQKNVISVSELLIFRNLTNRTYVGSLDTSHGMPNALRFALPHTATNLVLGAGFNGYQGAQITGGFAANAAVPPGDSQFSFTFDMPYSLSTYDFDMQLLYPIVRLSILLPPSIHGASDTLSAQGPQKAGSQVYDLFTSTALLPGKTVHLELDGLPISNQFPSASSTGSEAAPNPLYLIAALAIMAIIMLLTLFFYRSTRRRSATGRRRAASKDGQRRKQEAAKPAQAENVENIEKPDKAEKGKQEAGTESEEALLRQLLKLDKAYGAGKLKKADYEQRRAKLKARLRAIMSEKVTP